MGGAPSSAAVVVTTLLAGCAVDLAAQADGDDAAKACDVKYTEAYMSMLDGACASSSQQAGCITECQAYIDSVVAHCSNRTTAETDPHTHLTASHSFLKRAMQTLQQLGPVDCNYRMGFARCGPDCTMARITGGESLSDFEQHRCVDVDPGSGQSAPQAVFHS